MPCIESFPSKCKNVLESDLSLNKSNLFLVTPVKVFCLLTVVKAPTVATFIIFHFTQTKVFGTFKVQIDIHSVIMPEAWSP